MSFIAIYITHPNEADAKKIANLLLEEKLIACANIYPISSQYSWKGQIQDEQEWVSLVKTTIELWQHVKSKVEKSHPYEVPCIMKFEVEANEAYEEWIRKSVEL